MARFLSPEWFAELGPAETVGVPDGPDRADAAPAGAARTEVARTEVARTEVARTEVARTETVVEAAPAAVIEIVVSGAPEGEVRYGVVVHEGRSSVLPPGASGRSPELTITTDYATLCSMASGKVSALDVLMEGRARISGDTGSLSDHAGALAGLDLLPADVRARTTF